MALNLAALSSLTTFLTDLVSLRWVIWEVIDGAAMATKMPIKAMIIMSSVILKPFEFLTCAARLRIQTPLR
jgi:TRAP-type mannitol/chloroaromatic compound transport system permease small subunit